VNVARKKPYVTRVSRGISAWIAMLPIFCEIGAARPAAGWGAEGHALVTRAAVSAADDLPRWFHDEASALAELSNAPDRWRAFDEDIPGLAARRPDHFFDLDVWGDATLPTERWGYTRRAYDRRLAPDDIGFLPYAIMEDYGVLVSAFRDARDGRPGARLDALRTAGMLAHLVGDAAVPLHATRHHHGWVGRNERGFTRSPGVHRWFETELVETMAPAVAVAAADAEPVAEVPAAVRNLLRDSLARVVPLYEAEARMRAGDASAARALVRERLTVGATLLARIWRTAWARSAR
jgi:hypothetical protein